MNYEIIEGDALTRLREFPKEFINCIVTSPPYWGLRDYGMEGQLGREATPEEYVSKLVEIFREAHRVLRKDGTLWLNLGDSYASGGKGGKGGGGSFMKERRDGSWKPRAEAKGCRKAPLGLKHKDLVGIPWMVAFALRTDGWYLRSEIIWHKSNCLPESVVDRPTKAHEHIFLMSKSPKYFYDADAIREPHSEDSLRPTKRKFVYRHAVSGQTPHTLTPDGFCHPKGKNKRDVWRVSTKAFKGAHFATFPTKLIEPCVLAGCPPGGTVLDPFMGSGTTAIVALQYGRNFKGIELNPAYIEIAKNRIFMNEVENENQPCLWNDANQ